MKSSRFAALLPLVAALCACQASLTNPPAPAAPPAFERASAESVGWKSADLERVRAAVHAWVDAGEAVGAEFMILKDRKVVLHDVAGWKDVERKEPMERGTIFRSEERR